MPSPQKGESEKDFVSRCIPIVIKEGTAKDNKQAAAICHSMYRKKAKSSEEELSPLSDTGITISEIIKHILSDRTTTG